jgi:hypothetical protein
MGSFDAADLEAARQAGALSEESYHRLRDFLAARAGAPKPAAAAPSPVAAAEGEKPRFDVTHVLWYAGALIVMAAMGIFSTTAFMAMGGGALTVTGVIYGLGFLALGRHLWRKGLHTPGGLAITVAVSMVPLAIYGIQEALGSGASQVGAGHYGSFFEYIRSGHVLMEAGTILAGVVALRSWPFPFIVFVLAFMLWFLSMDLAVWFVGSRWEEFATPRDVSLIFGIVMIVVAWLVDLRNWRGGDFAFWLHLFGVMCFWGGLSLHASGDNLGRAIYALINIALIFLGVFLGRRVYAVFGTLGLMFYLGDLSWQVFDNVLLFSFALSFIGLGIIWLGLVLHRNERRLGAWLAHNLPPGVAALRPAHARVGV